MTATRTKKTARCAGPDTRCLGSRRITWHDVNHHTVNMAMCAEARVYHLPDGRYRFRSESGRVDFIANSLDEVDIKSLWPWSKEKK